ncbi:hypothetical protein [Streptomyces phaeolivaceus]|nr:hypothetical protein [Streptomyces phaeolivaceus]
MTLLQTLLSAGPAQAANVTDCPGGSSSGGGNSTCPVLINSGLLNQRAFPRTVYRGDSRTPFAIFQTGFRSRGPNDNVVQHVQGDRAGNSNYISTTGTLSVAVPFARSQGLRNLEASARIPVCTTTLRYAFLRGQTLQRTCQNSGTVTADTYIYLIDTAMARNAVYIPDQIRGNSSLYNHYASQDEWAYVNRIRPEAIIGANVYRMTARHTNGLIDTRSITFRYDRFVGNNRHAEALAAGTSTYRPNNDPGSNFTSTSSLNIPPLAANLWTRSCLPSNRCRR